MSKMPRCTCTGPASPAHDKNCPVRKRYPRLDLGDAPLYPIPLDALQDELKPIVKTARTLLRALEMAEKNGTIEMFNGNVATALSSLEDLNKAMRKLVGAT